MDLATLNSGHVVIANEQTQGRGQKGRSFASPKGEGIYMSILLKVDIALLNPSLVTICAALSVTEAIEKVYGLKTDIKWVNDIYCNGKKLCGILAESLLSPNPAQLSSIVIGIGINTGRVAPQVRDIATSLNEQTGLTGLRNPLIGEVLNAFETLFLDFTRHGKKQELLQAYDQKLFIKGKKVLIEEQESRYTAEVLGIDDDGALMVKDDQGHTHRLLAATLHLHWQ